MKTLRIFSFTALFMALAAVSFAQIKTEKFQVSGNCGMCKSTIEKAAKAAGAKEATWDKETRELTVKFNSSTTNTAKIQQQIADAGYDNAGFKTSLAAYNKLHACCQYDRAGADNKKASCCDEKCDMKDGKCADMAACKDKGCCKDEAACKEKGCCSSEGHSAAMDCCKDGKCSKPGHKGGDCCKKS
jgi:mercuric ion binding protein